MSVPAPPSSPLVGRDRELEILRGHLVAALTGRGGVVLVGGEAGIGKTALTSALGKVATVAGATVVTGRCFDLSATPPYGPWLDTGLFAPSAEIAGLTPERRRILDFLRAHPSSRPNDLAVALGLTPANAAQALHRMLAKGMVIRTAYGAYDLATQPAIVPSQTSQSGLALPTVAVPPLAALSRGDAPTPRGRAALFEQIRDFLTALARRRPLGLILEDMHWADPASLELLRFLARQLDTLPLLLIVTYRDDELTRQHPLYQLLPTLVREGGAHRLDLRPLDAAALRTLTATRYDLPAEAAVQLGAYLARRAGGNPLFALELLRALAEEQSLRRVAESWAADAPADLAVPAPLRQVIDSRLLRLGEEVRSLLAVAAVIGQDVPLDLWQLVTGATDVRLAGVVDAADAAHIFEEFPGARLRFRHALIREALYYELALPRRRNWHRRVGEILAAVPDAAPDDVAYHFRQAGDPRAAEWLIRAGERAERAYAWVTAAECLTAAADFLRGDAAALVRGWLLLRAGALLCYSHTARSIDLLDRAEQIGLALDDQELAINSRFSRGIVHCIQGTMRRGIAAMSAAIAAADDLARTDPAWPGKLTARFVAEGAGMDDRLVQSGGANGIPQQVNLAENYLVEWLAHAGHFREAVERGEIYLTRVAAAAPEMGLRLTACGNSYLGLGVARAVLGQPTPARIAFARAREAFAASDQRVLVSFTLVNDLLLALLPYRPEQLTERQRLADEEGAAQARGAGAFSGDRPLGIGTQWLHLLEGRWAEAEGLDVSERSAFEAGALRQYAVCTLGELARLRGDDAEAWRWVREVLPLGEATEPGDHRFFSAVYTQRLAATLALDVGDMGLARAWLASHDRWLAWSGAALWRAEGRLLWARYHYQDNDVSRALACAEEARTLAGAPRQPLALLAAERFLGELATSARDFTGAQRHLDVALELSHACALPYERLLTLLSLAELRAATQDAASARALVAEAHPLAVALGVRPVLARMATLEQRLVAAPRARGHGGLSAREVEVLRLAAEGLTDGQIAARLSISRRTVGQHLSSIYTRLDVPSRAAAVRVALARGVI